MAANILVPTVFYRDPKAALDWLEKAFGFEIAILLTDDAGEVAHAEMSFRGAEIGIGGEWGGPLLGGGQMRAPASAGGVGSQFIWVEVAEGLDVHCEQARAAGARIAQAPEDQFYGSRTYRALDPEGHVWCFRQAVREVSLAEMQAASGLKLQARGS